MLPSFSLKAVVRYTLALTIMLFYGAMQDQPPKQPNPPMGVEWKEAALAGLVVGLFALGAGMPRGFLVALPGALIAGLIGFGLYWFLMSVVIRWLAKGVKPKDDEGQDKNF